MPPPSPGQFAGGQQTYGGQSMGGQSFGGQTYGGQNMGGQGYVPVPPQGKKNRKKPLIIVIACLVAAALVGGFFALRAYQRHQEYLTLLDTGLRYLDEGNYEEAILAFNSAIEISPRSSEPYVGLGDAYMGLEDYMQALTNYRQALENGGDTPELYMSIATAYLETGDVEEAIAILQEGYETTKDRRLSDWADALFGAEGTGSLGGQVWEYVPGGDSQALPDARVRLYYALDEPRLIQSVQSDSEGAFMIENLGPGTYILHVDAPAHIGVESIETLTTDGENVYTELFLMIPETETVREGYLGSLSATVINAINGEPVPNAEIRLWSGWNQREGDGDYVNPDAVWTDSYGDFTIDNLDFGYYTVEITADGFVTGYHNVAVLPEELWAEWTLPISPVLGAGETRIVLTWGERPSDLDSHLTDGNNFHVYYWDKNYYDSSGRHRVNLDLDDTTSYGPETITVYEGVDRTYTYFVYDYTNRGSQSSTALGNSGATVRVYQGDAVVATFHVPAGSEGTNWTVFRLTQDGTIVPVNTMSYDGY